MRMDTFFPYRLAVAAEAFSRQLVEVYGHEHGLTREEWRLLFLLDDAGSLDSLEVAQRTSLDKVQVSRAASKLEEKGLITREVPRNDRRLRRYSVTPEGRKRFRQAFREVEARADEILAAMAADDRAALVRGVQSLHAATLARSRGVGGKPGDGHGPDREPEGGAVLRPEQSRLSGDPF